MAKSRHRAFSRLRGKVPEGRKGGAPRTEPRLPRQPLIRPSDTFSHKGRRRRNHQRGAQGYSDMASARLLPLWEKVAEGRMRGLSPPHDISPSKLIPVPRPRANIPRPPQGGRCATNVRRGISRVGESSPAGRGASNRHLDASPKRTCPLPCTPVQLILGDRRGESLVFADYPRGAKPSPVPPNPSTRGHTAGGRLATPKPHLGRP